MFDQRPANQVPPADASAAEIPESPADDLARSADLGAVMERARHENFPVALRVLPRHLREHLRAIYGYARLTDNLGDEHPGDRLGALDWLEQQLDSLYAGRPDHPVFRQLAPTVARFQLARAPFDQLLAANRLDQSKKTYSTWQELMEYCELSANPVGRLVLAVFESDTPDRLEASDAVCSGLQVLEHLQDVGEDARAGRIYLPADDMALLGCSPEDLRAKVAGESLRRLVEQQAARAQRMLEEGKWLVGSLRGYARLTVAGFVAGGLAGVDALEAAGFEVLGGTRIAGPGRLLRRYLAIYLGAVAPWNRN